MVGDRSRSEVGASVRDTVRGAFVTGVAVIVPLVITALVLAVAGRYVYRYLSLISTAVLQIGAETRFGIPGVGFVGKELLIELLAPVVLVGLIFVVGLFIDSTRYGGVAVDHFDAGVSRIPAVGSVYESFRKMSDVMIDDDTQNFREVKLVEFPHEGAYTLGFLTTETPERLREPTGHDRMVTLFLPLAPNPVMGGHLVHVPEDRVMDVDMTVEEGVRAVVTSGVAVADGTGASALSPREIRELSTVERVDQQFDPGESPATGRVGCEPDGDRAGEWDRRMSPERSTTPTEVPRRNRAARDGSDDEPIPDDREPDGQEMDGRGKDGRGDHA